MSARSQGQDHIEIPADKSSIETAAEKSVKAEQDDSTLDSSQLSSTTLSGRKRRQNPTSNSGRDTPAKRKGNGAANGARKRTKQSIPAIPWPEEFQSLSRTHRALNLVYTFCSARNHLATTFDKIKSAVEAQNGGKILTVEDIARLKVLLPHSIRFEVGDGNAVDMASSDHTSARRNKRSSWDDLEPHELAGTDTTQTREESGMLIFSFVDTDLRRGATKSAKKGNIVDDELRIPVYTHKQMLNLIEKRNKRFSDAVNGFLAKCHEELIDPVLKLEEMKTAYIPQVPTATASSQLPLTIPKDRKSMAEIIQDIVNADWYVNQIVPNGHRTFEERPPVFGDLEFPLSQNLVNALFNTRGIIQFYAHQAEAINNLHAGHHVIVSTSTSSGKSLIYQVPMLHALEADPNARGMYIFPTKALAQDQRRAMKELLSFLEGLETVMVETFDGDTPREERDVIRENARIIFTNPDMLHVTILPHHHSWQTFLKQLRYVVVDELHVYNGLFGAHVAFVMRRLRRICSALGNHDVQFVSCSATVSNPVEHMRTIFGIQDVKLTDTDGSPSGRKEFICWNTPFLVPDDPTSGRASSFTETARLFAYLILQGVKVIAFCKIRKQCEILLGSIRDEFRRLDRSDASQLVMGYRGGYSPQDRRQIEREMFEGRLLGIVATSALELGVDIGSLDAVISHGFPFSIANFRQQSGRAGRRNKDSLSILVGDTFALDQHYMRNPEEIFTKPNCELQVDLTNELILESHLQCAAHEVPIEPGYDRQYFGEEIDEISLSRLEKDEFGLYHCNSRFLPQPSRHVSLREIDEISYAIIDTTNGRNVVIEEIEEADVFFTVYEGGIFLHQGYPYLVEELNLDRHFARVKRVHVDWRTSQRDFTDVDAVETEARRPLSSNSPHFAYFGKMKIRTLVFGYFKMDKAGKIFEAVELNNPPIDRQSKGFWLDVPPEALQILKSRNMNAAAAIHAAEHALMLLLPSFVISSPGDVRTECKNAAKEIGPQHWRGNYNNATPLSPPARQRPARLVFYDSRGGPTGSGIASKAFEFAPKLLNRAITRIDTCPCTCPQGCAECVANERCKEMNAVLSKAGASVILRSLAGMKINVDELPWGEELSDQRLKYDMKGCPDLGQGRELPAGLETVIAARPVGGDPKKVVVYDLDSDD
ncbi:DEAD/DEAH box helicase [Ascosphaera apis ARSEF 7405]|uniref:DEAD/DEAH box helicase n=1 Tax=Ascosphaera apis ARSEF 7405 TaxID=392613 RepID=A0A162IA82_9EURO|nr:DEAD/DEAH box helicase [Ascosphaera apis ARSEF 7405]